MGITRYVLPVVVGAMGGMILITVGEMGVHHMYPLAPGTDLYDADSLAKAMKSMPVNAYIVLLVNYLVCSFLAGFIATMVAGRNTIIPAMVVGIVLTLAGIYNVVNLPHPLWYSIINLIGYMPCAYLGYLAVRKNAVAENDNAKV